MDTHITYSTERRLTPQQMAALFSRSGLNRPVDDAACMARMAVTGDLVITAWDGDQAIGLARSLTDFRRSCYLADLAVVRAYQRSGIGKRLIELTRRALHADAALILQAAPSAMTYYPGAGFTLMDNGFIIRPAGLPLEDACIATPPR